MKKTKDNFVIRETTSFTALFQNCSFVTYLYLSFPLELHNMLLLLKEKTDCENIFVITTITNVYAYYFIICIDSERHRGRLKIPNKTTHK